MASCTDRHSPYIDATLAAMECKIGVWHPTTECEHSGEVEIRRLQKLKSDLFKPRGYATAAQNEIMKRNHSASPFLRLPPELRIRIYGLVLGCERIWIDHNGSKLEYRCAKEAASGQWFHHGGRFQHATDAQFQNYYISPFMGCGVQKFAIRLDLLSVCRQIHTETALLPYALNTFIFQDDLVRRLFEQNARPGRKKAQRKAIGSYEIGSLRNFYVAHLLRRT